MAQTNKKHSGAFAAFIALATGLSVFFHGGNWFGKGYIMAIHFLAAAGGIFWLTGHWMAGPAALAICLIFWFGYRNTPVVRAEQDAMQWPISKHLNKVLFINLGIALVVGGACAGGLIYVKDWLSAAICFAAVMAVFPLPWLGLKYIFNFDTAFGKKLHAWSLKQVEKRLEKQRQNPGKKPSYDTPSDMIFGVRNCTEVVAGFFTAGVGTGAMVYSAANVIAYALS